MEVNMKELFKRVKLVSLLDGVMAIIFGLLMILCTDFTKETIVYLFAGLFVVVGVVKMVNYFLYGIEPFGFVLGIADVVLSIVLFSSANAIVESNVLGVLLGIVLLLKSLFAIQESFDLRRMGARLWWIDTILACVVFGFAISVVCNPASENVLFVLLGTTLVLDGLLNIVDVFVVSARVRKTTKTLKEMFKVDDNTTIEM